MSAAEEIRALVAGRPGSVNAFMARWGKLYVDYATALIPDRDPPFERLLEDLLVDAISQARSIAGARSDEDVRAFVIESALRTVRARFRAELDAPAAPGKATNSFTVEEIMARTALKPEAITAGISKGSIRAVRRDNVMLVRGADVPGLELRRNVRAWHVSAAQRELLCLRYCMNLSPEQIARFSGSSPGHVEALVGEAAGMLARGSARGGSGAEDTEMRRYIEGRLGDDETSRFENRVLRDKIKQKRLEELRGHHDAIRALFDSPAFDLSRVAVSVRERNPHQPMAIPPAAALWLQAVGIAALVLLLYRVGAFLPPPQVLLEAVEGAVAIDDGRPPETLTDVRVLVGQSVSTGGGGQAALVVDASNRVRLAGQSKLTLREPRPGVRQVLQLDQGELWARFASSGHSFAVLAGEAEVRGDAAAEFGLALGGHAAATLPDNLRAEQCAAFAASFEAREGALAALRAIVTLAGFRLGGPGMKAGDVVTAIDGIELDSAVTLQSALAALPDDQQAQLSIRRGEDDLQVSLRRVQAEAALILRVYRGSVLLHAGEKQPEQVNRGQWALLAGDQPALVGRRGVEDFRLLRMDGADRFKDRLHWLNTESFPLRQENNLLHIDRSLRELAGSLERLRENEVVRDGLAEITRFEEIMLAAFAAAQERIARGEPQARGLTATALGDLELVAARDEIMGAIAHWKRQGTTGAWTTLGAAGKTLHARIQRDTDDREGIKESINRSFRLIEEIKELDVVIEVQAGQIEALRADPLHDSDGSRRRELDAEAEKLAPAVRAGVEAGARIELITLKLNELDAALDDLRRQLPSRRGELAASELLLKEIDDGLAANIYTPQALSAAEEAAKTAEVAAQAAAKALAARQEELDQSDAELVSVRGAHAKAERDVVAPRSARDAAAEKLADAVAARAAAQKAHDDAKSLAGNLQKEYDALPQDDTRRAEVRQKLDDARDKLAGAIMALAAAGRAADDAKKSFDAAEKAASQADAALAGAARALREAEAARGRALGARDLAEREDVAARKSQAEAERRVDELKQAKQQREELTGRKAEAEVRLAAARGALATLELRIAEVDADAQPRREKLSEERAIVDAERRARESIEALKVRRDQHQAVSDEIALREGDLAKIRGQREQLADSALVRNHEEMLREEAQLAARVDAMKYLQERALHEDENFALAQHAAQDRYREAAVAATAEAVKLLDSACLPYVGFTMADSDADARLVRVKLMEALWRLYYEPGLDADHDGPAVVCYHVVLRAGGGEDALRAVDDRWKLALAQVLDSGRYEAASRLGPAELAQPEAKGD